MLLAALLLLILTAAVFAVTQIGALVTLLFIVAVLVLAYQRLPLLAFSIGFTVLFGVYTWFGEPAGLWKGLLLLMLVMMWLLNIRPLRKALISRPFIKTYLNCFPDVGHRTRPSNRHGVVGWRAVHGQARLEQTAHHAPREAHRGRAGLPRRTLRNTLRDGR